MEKEIKNPLFEEETEENITIEIQEPKHNFIIVYDSIYNNKQLTPIETALLIFLLSRSPNYKPSSRGIAYELKTDVKKINKASKSLQEKGYLKVFNYGKGKGSKWEVYQQPQIKAENLTYEYLSKYETFNIKLWYSLLVAKQINEETYFNLIDNLKKIATHEWITNKKK